MGGSGGILGMLKGNFSGLKGLFGFGNVSRDAQGGLWSTVGNQSINIDSLGGKLTALGKSDAALMGGAALVMDGLVRHAGSWRGIGEGAAGGALIGFKYGGPLGALIGGIAGFAAGVGEKLAGMESQEAEAKRLVKQIYGLTIDSSMAKQIVDMAKQKYGNSVSMAVRSSEVRQLLQLYADSTGQKSSMFTDQVRPASLVESGGALYQTATYRNGTPYTYGSYLPTLGPSGGTLPTGSPMGGAVTVMVSPSATQDLWRTGTAQAIAGDPRGVAQASLNGAGQSSARLNSAMTYLSPSAVWA